MKIRVVSKRTFLNCRMKIKAACIFKLNVQKCTPLKVSQDFQKTPYSLRLR